MNKYIEEIENWDWNQIDDDVNSQLTIDENAIIGRAWLGEGTSLVPSGKFYTPFANSNVIEDEANEDDMWTDALEIVAENHGLVSFWENGAAYAGKHFDLDEVCEENTFLESSDFAKFVKMWLEENHNEKEIALAEFLLNNEDYTFWELQNSIETITSYNMISVPGREYIVLTDSEADDECDGYFNSLIDEMLDSVPETIRFYFDEKQYLEDCRSDRGQAIASYDGDENEWGEFFIYRVG